MSASLRARLSRILPGIALVGFTVGTGSVTSMAKAGAEYGMTLLWALLLSCVVAFALFTAFGKLTVVSGKGTLQAIRDHIHPAAALFILLAVAINVSISVMGVMGIVADVLHRWSATVYSPGMSTLLIAAVLSGGICVVLLAGALKSIEKLLAVLAGVMALCFIINAVLVWPSLAEVAAGLIPRIPHLADDPSNKGGYLVTASMVGTTVAPVLFLFRSMMIHEEGWDLSQLHVQRRDALVSAVLIFIISAAVMISAAGRLRSEGYVLEEAGDMIALLQPVAGGAAAVIFVAGITAAGMSSQFPNVLSIVCMRRDFQGLSLDRYHALDRLLIVAASLLGLVVPLFSGRPVWIMVLSQALNAIVLPATILCVWRLLSNSQVMGSHVNRLSDNVIMGILFGFACFMSVVGISGVLHQLG